MAQHALPIAHLAGDLWVGQSRLFATNHGVWLRGGRAWLIDPGIYPEEIAEIGRFLAAHGAVAERIVLTHSHWDHILGPEHFPGVPVVAQAGYADVVRQHSAVPRGEVARWEAENGITRALPFTMPEPAETVGATAVFALAGLALELAHAPGHAPDQVTVYEPASATLWAADMLSDREIPFVSHSLAAYQATLAGLATREIRALVPGHGTPATDPAAIRCRLAEDRAYLAELHDRVARAVAAGWTPAETVATCADMRYRRPAENAGPHRWNVESAYRELGGLADPAHAGWSQEGA